jgi:RimJ/RimL family protein N-acetyltransferase
MFFQKGVLFAIRNKEGRVVGIIGSSRIDNRNRNLMIGLEIYNTKERGKGYGSEAIRLFTDFAFLEMNMHRVYLGCFDFNSHAGYLYERLGFRPEGINRSFVYRNGNYYNEVAFGVVKKDWLMLRGYL